MSGTQAPDDEPLLPKAAARAGAEKSVGVFLDTENGIYFTYETREIKAGMYRALMRLLLVIAAFFTLFLMWGVCSTCILIVAASACGLSCIGAAPLVPTCIVGVLVVFLKGFTFGDEFASVSVHWKI